VLGARILNSSAFLELALFVLNDAQHFSRRITGIANADHVMSGLLAMVSILPSIAMNTIIV
jgi:hypothetical protein